MIGILNAYHFEPEADYQKEYSTLFLEFVMGLFPDKAALVVEYKIAQGHFPSSVDECDIWFITGSPKSVYDDIPWVHQLTNFTKELHKQKKKTIGICFGHQMVSHALGGKVTKSPKGWGVGVRPFKLIKKEPWMAGQSEQVSLLFSHQDQVVQLPSEARLLASDDFCQNQMAQIESHILTIQGHPEFTVKFARDRLISRKDIIDEKTFLQAMNSYDYPTDYRLVSQWIREFACKK